MKQKASVAPGKGVAGRRGCRVVTTALSARLLLAHQLAELDQVDWTVVSGDAYEDAPENIHVEVVPIRREFALSDVTAFVALWRTFRRQRFDFAQTHTPKASFLGLPAARLSGTPAIYTIHGALYFRDNSFLANVLGWCFERWCCSWADRVLVQSQEDREVLPRVHICPERKLGYLGNGIVIDRFLTPTPPAMKAELPIVMMVSRLVLEKGCQDFLDVAAALRGRADFVHVGPTELDQADALAPEAIAEAEASGTVSFVGAVDDIRPYLASADIVMLPSYREGIPRAVMEAAVMGRPVVAYDIRGVREVIDPALGLVARRGDVAAITDLVGSLLDEPDRRKELGLACRDRVVDRFSEKLVVDRLTDVYASIAFRTAAGPARPTEHAA